MIVRERRLYNALKIKYRPLLSDTREEMPERVQRIMLATVMRTFFSAGYRAGLEDGRNDHKEPPLKLRPWKP